MEQGLATGNNDRFANWQSLVEYRVVIEAAADVRMPLDTVLKELPAGWESPLAVGQIEIGRLVATASQIPTVVRWLQRSMQQMPSFTLHFNNFSGIPPHQVHMRIQGTAPVMQLRDQLQKLNTTLALHELPTIDQPSKWQLPVADSLSGMIYQQVLQHFSKLELALSMEVTELWLMRREHSLQPWQPIQRLPLQEALQPSNLPWYAPCAPVRI
jgi:hypothetical protein